MSTHGRLFVLVAFVCLAGGVFGHDGSHTSGMVACDANVADGFACRGVDLMSRLVSDDIGGGPLNDIWGWTDSMTGREYALVGRFAGTSFVDVTDPESPVYHGELPSHADIVRKHEGEASDWRDVKVYGDYALIVSEEPGHGLQVFDLTQLRNVTNPPLVFQETARYAGFGSAHNLVVNEDTGFAYAVGSNIQAGGLHIVDIKDPLNMVFAGAYSGDGYTHDAQCVVYSGPDVAYTGRELCFCLNEDTLTIVDVTDKSAPVQLSRRTYSLFGYAHQGWLTDDQRHFISNDEADELNFGMRTRTLIWNVADVDAPVVAHEYSSAMNSIDHNNYVTGRYLYQSNYTTGLRVLDVSHPTSPLEVGFFDTYNATDAPVFDGSWSNYPFFASGTVVVSDISEGLFVVRPQFTDPAIPSTDLVAEITSSSVSGSGVTFETRVENRGSQDASNLVVTIPISLGESLVSLTSTMGSCVSTVPPHCEVASLLAGETFSVTAVVDTGQPSLMADVRVSALNPDDDTRDNTATAVIDVPGNSGGGGGFGGGDSGGGAVGLFLIFVSCLVRRRTNV